MIICPRSGRRLASQAFIAEGFKHATDYELGELRDNCCDLYGSVLIERVFRYDYKKMNEDNKWMNHEIIEYLWQPHLVEKWLETGNEMEDYPM
jgi:hypothetical protein